jgi:threonine synthase
MKYFSTNNKNVGYSFRHSVLKGLADDGGLFVPEFIPKLTKDELSSFISKTFSEIAFDVSKKFIESEINSNELFKIIQSCFDFEPKFVQLNDNVSVLELFHGPTLAFKDFGARFMAGVMSYFAQEQNQKLTILVATSGDTGSAVANAFYLKEGIDVFILYPSGMVSEFQEKQLTTYGSNITALEIDGTFDDCQRLVKSAFTDTELNNLMKLSSANSINIARLIPQSFYYLEALKKYHNRKITFIVPSGNLGNLTAGLYADKMSLENASFIAALNSNNMFYDFLSTGKIGKKQTVKTISNAMDVGNPSNIVRIVDLFNDDINQIRKKINSCYFSDSETISSMKECFQEYNYILDPHGGVGFSAMKSEKKYFSSNSMYIILETAHHSKFADIVEGTINKNIEIPERLSECLKKEKKSVKLTGSFTDLKEFLTERK